MWSWVVYSEDNKVSEITLVDSVGAEWCGVGMYPCRVWISGGCAVMGGVLRGPQSPPNHTGRQCRVGAERCGVGMCTCRVWIGGGCAVMVVYSEDNKGPEITLVDGCRVV